MTLDIKAATPEQDNLKPRIMVIGVGGAGCNAVNNMINCNLDGVNFLVANTDSQTLENSLAKHKIQLGHDITKGLGAGAKPQVGMEAALEAADEIRDLLDGANMLFITAGMGGGTGTGAAPVIARIAQEMGILTVGVATKPFDFEGKQRMRIAEEGAAELQKYVGTLIMIPNQNLFCIANEKTTFSDAFKLADDVLYSGVRGITDLIVVPGLINLDFADIRTVMGEMGKAMMGTGEADGDNRAITAAEKAISNPLLDDVTMQGAKQVLINITAGPDLTLFEIDEAVNRIREEVDDEANIHFGAAFDNDMEGKIRVSVVATGIDGDAFEMANPESPIQRENEKPTTIKDITNNMFSTTQYKKSGVDKKSDAVERDDEKAMQDTPKLFADKDSDNLIHANLLGDDFAEEATEEKLEKSETETNKDTEISEENLNDNMDDETVMRANAIASEPVAIDVESIEFVENSAEAQNTTSEDEKDGAERAYAQSEEKQEERTEAEAEEIAAFIPDSPVEVAENPSQREEKSATDKIIPDPFMEAELDNIDKVDSSRRHGIKGFFNRLTKNDDDMGNSNATATVTSPTDDMDEKSDNNRQEQPTLTVQEGGKKPSSDDELLEIPAFLRRQAN